MKPNNNNNNKKVSLVKRKKRKNKENNNDYDNKKLLGFGVIIILLLMIFLASSNPVVWDAKLPLESNGAVPVNIQDQTTPPFDLYFIQSAATPTTLLTNATINNLELNITNTVGFIDGCYIGVFSPDDNRFFFAEQLGAPVVNTITLDNPIDFNFTVGDNVLCFDRDLNKDGSGTTEIFEIQGPGGNQSIDITRIMLQITTASAPAFSSFGDIVGGLTNGIVLRRVNGDIRNIWNIKLNQEFALHAFDYATFDATNPGQGVWGVAVRYTFSGQDKHGVAIRLEQGESLELWIQDDLTDLLSFRILAEGHIVTD